MFHIYMIKRNPDWGFNTYHLRSTPYEQSIAEGWGDNSSISPILKKIW